MTQVEQPLTPTERKRQLVAAAEALLPDYAEGSELTVFTALDSEDFYAYYDCTESRFYDPMDPPAHISPHRHLGAKSCQH